MIKETQYTSIKNLLDRLTRHPMLKDISLESVVQYTIDFIAIFGLPKMYMDKETTIQIKDYRGLLPCDLVSINQVQDAQTKICLRSMDGTFLPKEGLNELQFKTQGNIIFTTIEEGELLISYKAIPVDKEGYPLLSDNPVFLRALELFIKENYFTILFDMGKISPAILQNTQQQYSWAAGQLEEEYTIPSISEMESLKNSWCTLIQRTTEFDNGFSHNGDREYIRNY